MKETLTENLTYAIERGWDCWGLKHRAEFEWEVQDLKLIIKWKGWLSMFKLTYSISEIYASHSFWVSICGKEDKWYTTDCTCGGLDFHAFGHDTHKPECARAKANRGHLYHISKCIQLETNKERSEYVNRVIKDQGGVKHEV